MKKPTLNSKALIKKIAEKEAKLSVNSTTCITLYQPQAPEALKKFSKIK